MSLNIAVNNYLELKKTAALPRLPLEGSIDLTFRCNNNCRHCWLRLPPDSEEEKEELSFEEIKKIVDQARMMGCRKWSISGGEPMLRPDFPKIFEYLTDNINSYSINTNGTLITPKIAKLMARKGIKMVALYGATKDVHDHITRNPGSFEATMRGFQYLKEAGAGFTVQLIPMKDNYYQFKDMIQLAESLSKHYRVGAAWLHLSDCLDKERNMEIIRQRLTPKEVVELDKPDLSFEERVGENSGCYKANKSGYLFASCIDLRRDFHIDPYGKMTFCCLIKEPSFRYDLRKGSFQEAWEDFIPSLAKKIKVTKEYKKHCGACELRKDCRWCPVYGYLEHRKFDAKVDYLCAVAKKNREFKDNWGKNHRRYFSIADSTVQLDSDLPITKNTFHPKFRHFEVDGPGEDNISIRHHFYLPDLEDKDLGKEVYRKAPWAIYKKNGSWIYLGISSERKNKGLRQIAVFNSDHTRAEIYNDKEAAFLGGNLQSLTLFPTDQILLARILADRQGCYIHSCGVNFQGKGLIFAGHSEAGKSTIATMLKGRAEILCDDRIIIRKKPDGFKIYGTWSHGDVPDVSVGSAPLNAILFLEKSQDNKLIPLADKKEITKKLLACLIKPFVTADWWEKTLSLTERVIEKIPCYRLHFDKSGRIVELLEEKLLID
ncbi:MAG: radical SAM protein [Candidatus Omnitrophota bacterium]